MHASHWQLRAFVHSPKPNHIHYLGWRDIYEVNTSTKQRKIIGTLPFSPRCFTSKNGLMCAGGDDGKFAVIRLSETETSAQRQREADEAIDSFERLEHPWLPSSSTAQARAASPPELPDVETKQFGDQILNCITMWFPGDDADEGAYTLPVAVIASNDNHMYIVDTGSKNLIQKLYHDQPVNLGQISPDGSVMVVVGDDPYMHVYKRTRVSHNHKLGSASGTFEWEKFSQAKLPGQRLGNTDDMRGSFTGSFSHRYLAIGTQYGEIAIFEIEDLKNLHYPKPAVIFSSTRPNTKEGAIRSLQFNPSSSLDLLAITEDSGMALVVDVRQFGKQQILETDQEAGYEETKLMENRESHSSGSTLITAGADTDEDEPTHGSALTRHRRPAAATASEQTRDMEEVLSTYGNRRLSQNEMGVLLAMQSERRRREANHGAGEPLEVDTSASASTSSLLTPTSTAPSEAAAPLRRSAPRSEDRLRAISTRMGHGASPMQTAARLDSALSTHLARHRARREERAAERRAFGREMTAEEAEADANEARQARAMAEMMAVDAANLRQQANADFFDLDRLRENGLHRTAAAVLRITNSFARAEMMERQRREEAGEPPLPEESRFGPPFGLMRQPLENRPPAMVHRTGANRLDAEEENPVRDASQATMADVTPTSAREPLAVDPTTVDLSSAVAASPRPPAGILGDGRRYRVPTLWGRGPTRSFLTESEYLGSRYSHDDEESLPPEERERLQQRRAERMRDNLAREQMMTRQLQSMPWVPPERIATSGREFLYVRSNPTSRNQTTGCAWASDGQTL